LLWHDRPLVAVPLRSMTKSIILKPFEFCTESDAGPEGVGPAVYDSLGVKPGPQRESDSAGIARYAGAAQRYAKASKAHHPAQPNRLVPAPAGTVTQAAFYTRTLANAMSLTWMSVQPSTLETYATVTAGDNG